MLKRGGIGAHVTVTLDQPSQALLVAGTEASRKTELA